MGEVASLRAALSAKSSYNPWTALTVKATFFVT
jgi:hypothetical protein